MKKIYAIVGASVLAVGMNAQSSVALRNGNLGHGLAPVAFHPVNNLATGDTLMYTDGNNFYVNPTDQANFQFATEDDDGLALAPGYASAGFSMDWGVFYSLDSSGSVYDLHQSYENNADTAFCFYAVSWFANPGQANNWMMYGPITVPATGAKLDWEVKNNPAWRDGYEVLVSTAAGSPPSSSDFVNANIYSRGDLNPDPNDAQDTVWAHKSVQLPAYCNGQQTWVAFHHNANDMDVLYIDDMLLTDYPMGVQENQNAVISQNSPNPANGNTVISYSLNASSSVLLNVYDVTGQLVYSQNEGTQASGSHRIDLNTSNLANGMYYYSFVVNGEKITRKFVVENK